MFSKARVHATIELQQDCDFVVGNPPSTLGISSDHNVMSLALHDITKIGLLLAQSN